jgi:hypothetical protein
VVRERGIASERRAAKVEAASSQAPRGEYARASEKAVIARLTERQGTVRTLPAREEAKNIPRRRGEHGDHAELSGYS